MLWSHCPSRDVVSYTTRILKNDMGNYMGLYISVFFLRHGTHRGSSRFGACAWESQLPDLHSCVYKHG